MSEGSAAQQGDQGKEEQKDYVIGVAQEDLVEHNHEPPLAYFRFVEALRHPEAGDVFSAIRSFVGAFLERSIAPQDQGAVVRQFFQRSEKTLKSHPVFVRAGVSQSEISEGLEKLVMLKIEPKVFGKAAHEVERDVAFVRKCHKLREFLLPHHLEIPPIDEPFAPWPDAQRQLLLMSSYGCPRDKLSCIVQCSESINSSLCEARSRANPPGADDFFPALIYTVIHASPPSVFSTISYVCTYRNPDAISGKANYFLHQFYSALTFVEDLTSESLRLDPIDFSVWMDEQPDKGKERQKDGKDKPSDAQGGAQALDFGEVDLDSVPVAALPSLVAAYNALRRDALETIRRGAVKGKAELVAGSQPPNQHPS